MNTNRSTNRKFRRMLGNILSIVMILAVAFPAMAPVSAQGPMPHIEAFAWLNRYSLVDWPADIPVQVTIQNPAYEAEPFVPDGSSNWYDFFPEVDLQPGSVITATNGEVTKVLEISPLSATVNADTGNVAGIATGGRTFHMRTDGDHFQLPIEQDIEADSAGNWSVTIGDYLPWEWLVRGEMWEGDEDGDITYAIWHVQQQVVEVWLAQNEIRAFGWPLDSALTFSVDGNDVATEVAPEPVDWMESTWAVVRAGDLQLQPGMEVTVTDGTSPKSTVVQDVKITNIDIDNDTVYGYGPLNADLELGSWEDSPVFRFFNNGEDENWLVDYKEPSLNDITVDLNPGDEIRLFLRDEEKDSTVWGSFAPNPHLIAFPENEAVEAWEWPDGSTVTLTIDHADSDFVRTATAHVTTWGDPRTYVRFEFADAYDLQIGDTVTLTGEDGMTRVHTVQNLSVTEANGVTDTVSGTADQGATVQVWPHGHDGDYFVEATAENGTWIADFGKLGFYTIEETGGRSQIVIDGNATAVDWNASWPPSTFAVNTTDDLDDGNCDETHCSLREAINVANARFAPDTIVFNIPGEAPFTIQPGSPLPNIEDQVTLDGTTQPGFAGSPIIELDGTYAGEWVAGLVIAASDSTVKGLAINRFGGDAIVIYGSGNSIQSNYLGTDVTGITTMGSTSGPEFGDYDVEVEIACLTYDAGTDRDGFISESSVPLAPWSGTSVIFKGTDECVVSDSDTFEGAPLIYRYRLTFDELTELASIAVSGAAFNGGALRVLDQSMNVLGTAYNFGGNSFQTNYVSLSGVVGTVFFIEEYDFSSDWRYRENIVINGPLPLGNRGSGVLLAGGATNNTVIENLISGNLSNGVAIFNPGTTGNVVQENYIGTDITGSKALGSGAPGVGIGDQAYDNFIIGNLISGNGSDGVAIFNAGTNGNTLEGNNIGTDVGGMLAIPNAGVGIWIGQGALNTRIGGTDASVRNVIAGNKWGGVSINDLETTGTRVTGNYIGTNKSGDAALPNGGDGVYISGTESVIGGSEPGTGNVISGNTASGVSMAAGATGNLIQGNFIGTDVSGTAALYSASGPEFGHYGLEALPETCPTYDAGTDRDGFISQSSDPLAPWGGTSVMFMGTDEDKCGVPETFEDAPLIYRYKLTFAEPTELTSIAVTGAAFNGGALRVLDENMEVLGTAYNFGGNSYQTNYVRLSGVVGQMFFIEEYDYSSDWRYRESIVINGQLPIGNLGSGVNFNSGASNNLVLDNLISGNRSDAVSLYHTGTNGNVLQGNYIGTDFTGTAAVPNTSAAIWIGEGASNTVIGGTEEGQGNIVSGNTGDAISINHAETTGTLIQGNFIGTDVTGSVTLPNNSNGIVLVTGTHDNVIGGTEPGAGNVISGNFGDGVLLVDGGTSGNSVQHNFIGTDLTGTIALGNWNRGLYIGGGASDNLVSGNVISGNGAAGIRLADFGTTGNQIQGNFIGTDITGVNPLGNGYIGIRLTDGASYNMIGGTEPGAGNVIAFNAATGIAMSGDDVTGNALLSNSVFSNGSFGIDLGEDGVTLNDLHDPDNGPNYLQNYPIINTVTGTGTSVIIKGLLDSSPGTMFRLEFFSTDTCDPSGYGEGQAFLGFVSVKTNPAGIARFDVTLPVSLPAGTFVTATATDPSGNTSEFSRCFSPRPGWNLMNDSGFGDPSTIGVSALEIFQNVLYAGASNWNTGGQIWRLGQDGLWSQVIGDGFGSGPESSAVIDLGVFQGQLYAGTGWNGAPGQVWRSANGSTWQPVTTDGFGDPDNIAVTNFVVFKSMLYAGTGSTNGSAQIWRSSTGGSGTWTQVAPDGAWQTGNVTGFAVYKNVLYAAVEPAGGVGAPIQVWRSTNGSDWTTVTSDGFGDEGNVATGGFGQFGGYLYLGTRNDETGAQLWRTQNGMNWQKVVGDGFGDLSNIKIESLLVFNDLLYAATHNPSMGLQVWRSADGMNWEQVAANGFGDSNNFSTLWNSATVMYQGQLLIGTWNNADGGELWRFTP